MKNFRILSLLGVILLTTALVGCGNNNKGDVIIEDSGTTSQDNVAINYNDNLVNLTSQCTSLEESVRSAYDATNNPEDLQPAIDNMISKCSNIGENIKNLGDLDGDSSLKDGVMTVIEKEIAYYSKLIEILPYLGIEELSDEENEIYEGIHNQLQVLDEELTNANGNLIKIQEQFARNHGFELEDADQGYSEEDYTESEESHTDEEAYTNEEEPEYTE